MTHNFLKQGLALPCEYELIGWTWTAAAQFVAVVRDAYPHPYAVYSVDVCIDPDKPRGCSGGSYFSTPSEALAELARRTAQASD